MGEYPLTSAQRDIWLDQVGHPDLPLYNIGGYLRIEGPIDHQLFIQCMHRLVAENDSLRMMLRRREPLPTQEFVVIDKLPRIEFPFIDYSQYEDGYERAIKWLKEQFSKPFLLYNSLLFRYAVAKASDNCYFYLNCQHHLIADGWAVMLITNRLVQIYREQLSGVTEQQTKTSYINYINDEIRYFSSDKYLQCKQFWNRQYQSLPSTQLVSHSSRRQERKKAPSAISHLPIARQTFEQLKQFCEFHQVSFFHFILGVFYVYFMNYDVLKNNKNEELIVGIPVLNRRGHAFKQTVGLFTSVIPQRLNFGLELNFLALLSQIKKALRDSYRSQRFPLSDIRNMVTKLHSASDSSHSNIRKSYGNLFDVTISQESFDYNCSFHGENVEAVTLHSGFEQTPLSIAIKEYHKHRDFRIEFVYNLANFNAQDIDLIKKRIFFLLSEIPQRLEHPLSQIAIIPEIERQQLLNHVVLSQEHPAVQENIIDWFDRQVLNQPGAVALVFKQQQLSYQELKIRAEQLAAYLQAKKISPGALVGVYFERSIEMIISVLAIMKMGGTYLPIDVSNPRARVLQIIQESQLKWIISQSCLVADFPEKLEMIHIDELDLNHQPAFNRPNLSTFDLAYVIYTSGSTGSPKGVMNTHAGLYNLVQSQIDLFEISGSSNILQFASLGFDASVSEIFTALCAGASLTLCDATTLHDYNELLKVINDAPISHITLPPSILNVLDASQMGRHCTIIAAGENCSLRLAKKWVKDRTFINAYGPTEGTVCSTVAKYKQQINTISIGTPISNVVIYILGAKGELLPLGMPGEIYISGINLAKGYLNHPELTRQQFIDNPFLLDKQNSIYSRLYKSGDMGRLLANGEIEYLGRKDQQVKIRGFRIELGEIEAKLLALPLVKQAAVIVHQGEHEQKKLIAFYRCEDSLVPNASDMEPEKIQKILQSVSSEQDVLAYLKQQLPDYMVPHRVNRITQFPLTSNAKIDHKKLLNTFLEKPPNKPDITARTLTEKQLTLIVADILDNVTPGVLDKLIQYGMDSLQTIRLQMEINRQFKLALSLADLLHLDTIRELSLLIDQQLLNDIEKNETKIKQTHFLNLDKAQHKCLLQLQNQGDKPPLFCVTAGFRQIAAFKELAILLGDSQPFYLLQPELNHSEPMLSDLLDQYIENIIAIEQKRIRLIGYSVGGLVAQKIAVELQKRGYTVELMVLLGSPANITLLEKGLASLCRMESVFLKPFAPKQQDVRQKCMDKLFHFFFKDQGLQRHLVALKDSSLKKYQGRIDYIEGQWSISRMFRWQTDWEKYSTRLFMHLIPGGHNSIIGASYNKALVRQINQLLKEIKD